MIFLSVSTSAAVFSFSSQTPLKISLSFTLQSPSPPITFHVKGTIFQRNSLYGQVHEHIKFMDVASGEPYQPTISEVQKLPPPPWENELSYRNAQDYETLYPGRPYIVERNFKPGLVENDPMQPGHQYKFVLDPETESMETWWAYGEKWQVLKWPRWPFGNVQYTCSRWGENYSLRKRPGPFKIECVQSTSIKIVN